MKKWFIIGIIGFVIFLSACGRRSYRYTDIFADSIPAGIQRIPIDDSYRLYRRDVYKEKDTETKELTVKENKELKTKPTDPGKLIEVEYLLISQTHNNALYITTIPDRRQVYYAENKLSDDLVNIQDFNTFHLGKIKEAKQIEFLFPGKHSSNTWEFFEDISGSERLSLHKLIFKVDGVPQYETQADISLEDTVEFQHIGEFFLVLSKPKKKNEERKIFPSKDNIIYARKKKSNYQLLFRFNEPINKKDSTVVFGGKLIRHTAEPLLKE